MSLSTSCLRVDVRGEPQLKSYGGLDGRSYRTPGEVCTQFGVNWEPLRGVEQESGVTKAMSELELT